MGPRHMPYVWVNDPSVYDAFGLQAPTEDRIKEAQKKRYVRTADMPLI